MYHQSFAADAEVSSQAITPALMMDVDKVNPSGYNGGNWMNRIIKECWCQNTINGKNYRILYWG